MKKASEYRLHAKECRKLATTMDSLEQRNQLLQMAEQWDKLAADRLGLIRNHPELDDPSEREEECSFGGSPSPEPRSPVQAD